MRTLTLALSGSSIRPHSRPRSSPLSPQRCERSSRTSVGHSRQLPSCVNDSLVRPFQQQSSSHPYVTDELRTSRNSGNNHMMEFEETDKTCQHIGSYSGICTTNSLKHDRDPLSNIYGGLKLALLIGLVTYQGSQPALASTEFSGLMQISTYIGDLGDISTGFASAFLLIFFSELGDKTFFIAALLAARNSGPVIFIGTFGALAAMSVISVILGRTFHYVDDILPFRFGETDFPVDDLAAACLLVYFGVSTLIEATTGDGLKIKEEQEEAEIAISELSGNGAGIMAAANTVFSTFLLVFVAEWGDKSFFSTIALAAACSPLGVIGGALAGHALATLIAVLGGSILGTFLSDKIVAYIGGSLFLVFAAVTLVDIVR